MRRTRYKRSSRSSKVYSAVCRRAKSATALAFYQYNQLVGAPMAKVKSIKKSIKAAKNKIAKHEKKLKKLKKALKKAK